MIPPQKAQKSQAGRQNFLSGALCPFPDISPCGSRCGSVKNRKNKSAQKVLKIREIPPESSDSSGILELLPRFELGTSSLPKEQTKHILLRTNQKQKIPACNPAFAVSKKLQTGGLLPFSCSQRSHVHRPKPYAPQGMTATAIPTKVSLPHC